MPSNKSTVDTAMESLPKSVRLIKKYPNRRLYDTKHSTYIVLEDIRNFVISGESFQVIDVKTGDNVTRNILLQIVLESELQGQPLFTEVALTCMIRFYGNTFQAAMGHFLEKNMHTFIDIQTKIQEQNKSLFVKKSYNPDRLIDLLIPPNLATQAVMGTYLEQSKQAFLHMQELLQTHTLSILNSLSPNINSSNHTNYTTNHTTNAETLNMTQSTSLKDPI